MIQEDVEYNIGCENFKFNMQLLEDLDSEYVILYNRLNDEINIHNNNVFKQLNQRYKIETHNKTRLSTNLKLFGNDPILNKWQQNIENINTPDELIKFINHTLTNYDHTYSSIVCTFSYIALASLNIANNFGQGNVSGYQYTSIIDQIFLIGRNMKGPIKLIKYNDFLYPQYEYQYNKTITKETWEYIYDQACDLLIENFSKSNDNKAHPDVVRHWESIVHRHEVPFGYTIINEDNEE